MIILIPCMIFLWKKDIPKLSERTSVYSNSCLCSLWNKLMCRDGVQKRWVSSFMFERVWSFCCESRAIAHRSGGEMLLPINHLQRRIHIIWILTSFRTWEGLPDASMDANDPDAEYTIKFERRRKGKRKIIRPSASPTDSFYGDTRKHIFIVPCELLGEHKGKDLQKKLHFVKHRAFSFYRNEERIWRWFHTENRSPPTSRSFLIKREGTHGRVLRHEVSKNFLSDEGIKYETVFLLSSSLDNPTPRKPTERWLKEEKDNPSPGIYRWKRTR